MNQNLKTPVNCGKFPTALMHGFVAIIELGPLVLAPGLAHSAIGGSFTLVGSTKQFRRAHTATLLFDGKVLVAGGAPFLPAATSAIYDPFTTTWTNSGALSGTRLFTDRAEVYDASAKNRNGTGPLSFSRAGHQGISLTNGMVLVAGGFNTSDTGPSTELFDPASAVADQYE